MAKTLDQLLEGYESEEAKAYVRHVFEASARQAEILAGKLGLPSEVDAVQGYRELRDQLSEGSIEDIMGVK